MLCTFLAQYIFNLGFQAHGVIPLINLFSSGMNAIESNLGMKS